jgi:hypothetical protein
MRSSVLNGFSRRVSTRELPQRPDGDCTYEEFRDCLFSLEKGNRWLLSYDVGPGGGYLLQQIGGWRK